MASPHYGTREEADTYFEARGATSWAQAAEADRDAALVRASSYIDGRYRDRFPGRKAGGRAQPREWPRLNAADASGEAIGADEVPAEVVSATYEAALREVAAPGSLTPDFVASAIVKSERKKVGPIEKEIEFATPTTADAARPVLSVIDDLLAGLLTAKASARTGSAFLMRT